MWARPAARANSSISATAEESASVTADQSRVCARAARAAHSRASRAAWSNVTGPDRASTPSSVAGMLLAARQRVVFVFQRLNQRVRAALAQDVVEVVAVDGHQAGAFDADIVDAPAGGGFDQRVVHLGAAFVACGAGGQLDIRAHGDFTGVGGRVAGLHADLRVLEAGHGRR